MMNTQDEIRRIESRPHKVDVYKRQAYARVLFRMRDNMLECCVLDPGDGFPGAQQAVRQLSLIHIQMCIRDRIYYYTTYENSQITGVDMHREDLDGRNLVSYPLIEGQQILMQN